MQYSIAQCYTTYYDMLYYIVIHLFYNVLSTYIKVDSIEITPPQMLGVCVYVCMYVCMYAYIYTHLHT